MQESLILFDSLVNARWFANSATILFLNKVRVTQVVSSFAVGAMRSGDEVGL